MNRRFFQGFDPRKVDPFVDLSNFREAIRQMVESGWMTPRDLMPSAMASVVFPIDVLDLGPELIVLANLPGIRPEDVSITVLNDVLSIKATPQPDNQYKGAVYLHRERRRVYYNRSVKLPYPVESDHSEAKVEDGVLTLKLIKSDAVRPKSVKVISE